MKVECPECGHDFDPEPFDDGAGVHGRIMPPSTKLSELDAILAEVGCDRIDPRLRHLTLADLFKLK